MSKPTQLTQGDLFFDMNKVKKMDRFEQFMYWIVERHKIYLARKAGKLRPWTNDPILQGTSFTNVYRELDKTTIWYRKYVADTFETLSPEHLIFATIAFRWFNLISTGEELLKYDALRHWNTKKVISLLREKRPVFTGAFVISNGGPAGVGVDKLTYVCKEYIKPIWEKRREINAFFDEGPTLCNAHAYLQQYKGFGGTGFMAAQVICDLKYTEVLNQADDWLTWSSQGPGSAKGLNYLLTGKLETKTYPKHEWLDQINKVRKRVNVRLTHEGMEKLHAQDLQNCFCEFSKYIHVLGGGRAKRKYKGV